MAANQDKPRYKPLLTICLLLSVSALMCLVDMWYVIGHIRETTIAFASILVATTTLLDAVFLTIVVVRGLKLHREKKSDTSDAVNRCQSAAIASAGFCAIDWIIDALVDRSINLGALFVTVCTLVFLVLYYRIVQRMEHTTFWDGIRTTHVLEPYISVGEIPNELIIDPDTRLMRSLKTGETPDVFVLTADEYIKTAPVRILQQIMHSMNNVRRSSCIQLGEIVFGNVYITKEVQRAAGFDANADLAFSYQYLNGCLTLIMDEDSVERTFLAQSLVDQYLEKSTSLTLVPEMITMLAMRISNWIAEYENRLARLESNLNDDVYEMPKGFSEFVSDARRELGAIQGFCRQTADMLEDLTQVANNCGYERAAYQYATISRNISRLAMDADEVRDTAGEIRAAYQERIEVRQNNVMSVLTIVETVFTPLALVTGWYGMNFINMPELKHPDAYFIVVAIMIFLIATEFATFKRRRWF